MKSLRHYIDIIEATHAIPKGNGMDVTAIENPTAQQLAVMVERYQKLRGLIDENGHVYIWNAHDLTHHNAEMYLGLTIDLGFYIDPTEPGHFACTWEDYTGEGHTPEQFPAFVQMMRRGTIPVARYKSPYSSDD